MPKLEPETARFEAQLVAGQPLVTSLGHKNTNMNMCHQDDIRAIIYVPWSVAEISACVGTMLGPWQLCRSYVLSIGQLRLFEIHPPARTPPLSLTQRRDQKGPISMLNKLQQCILSSPLGETVLPRHTQ